MKLQYLRNCPYLDEDDQEKVKLAFDKAAVRKYDTRAAKLKRKQQKEEGKERDKDDDGKVISLQVNDHKIYSCPVATMNDNRDLTSLIELINWSSEMKTPLVDGGLLNHTNWYFQCYQLVIGEQNKIEKENIEKQKQDKPKPKTNSKTSKNKIGRKGK